MAEKKLEGKPRTVGAAKKAGSKFFYDKNGNKKLAVTAEELKKSGKTLTQWANDWKKPGSSTAVSKSLRPKKRPPSDVEGYTPEPVTVKELDDPSTASGRGNGKAEVKKRRSKNNTTTTASSNRGKSFGTRVRKRKPGGPDPLGLTGKKTYVSALEKSKLTKLKSYTFKEWDAMSKDERKKLRLPMTAYPGSKKMKVVQRPLNIRQP